MSICICGVGKRREKRGVRGESLGEEIPFKLPLELPALLDDAAPLLSLLLVLELELLKLIEFSVKIKI